MNDASGTLAAASAALDPLPARIVSVESLWHRIPLAEVLVDAGHGDHTHFELVLCKIRCADDSEGVGYTYTGGRGGSAIHAVIRDELAPLLAGSDADDVEGAWERMGRSLHYLGCGGIIGFAIAAADIALWDLRCRRRGKPLWQLAGGHGNRVHCYRGLIDLGYTDDQLVDTVRAELASGHTGIKLKVGRPEIDVDVRRARLVRDILGPDLLLMADANYSWSPGQAIAFARAVEDVGLRWLEEPTDPFDYDGYAAIAAATSIPLASGENLRTLAEFREAIRHARLSYVQPDASNVGGITGWLKVARLAAEHKLPVSSHGMHELHISLMAAQEHAAGVEIHSFPIDQYTTRPVEVVEGQVRAPDDPGTGVTFDPDRLRPHLVRQD